ncbi:hypothetical protein ACFQ3Z_29890 [Streptomyces nogalater]
MVRNRASSRRRWSTTNAKVAITTKTATKATIISEVPAMPSASLSWSRPPSWSASASSRDSPVSTLARPAAERTWSSGP